MSRLTATFAAARKARRAAFVAYVTAGDPNLSRTPEIATALRRAGADVLELGVPFSDPLADGLTNQLAAERALAAGTTLPATGASIDLAVATIGVVAGLATLVAMRFAGSIARRIGSRAEIVAGIVLIGLGVKIVLEHTGLLPVA